MGIFDDSPYSDPTQAAPAQAAPAAVVAQPNPNAIPGQNDFIDSLVGAARKHVLANPGSLMNWISPGRAQDAAEAEVRAKGPALYQALLAQQSATRNAQLGTAGNIASQGAMTGTAIQPDNIDASIPAMQKAYQAVFNGGQAQGSDANAAPANSAPADASAPANNANPITQIDALFGGKPVNPDIVQGVESNNDPNAVSPKGAGGLMQVMPTTGAQPGFGVAPMNGSADNKRFGADYLSAMQARYHSPTLGLIAYNMGPGATDKWLKAGANIGQLPQETRDYVGKVINAHHQAGLLATPQQPQAQPQPVNDQDARQRAWYMSLSKLATMRGDNQGAKNYFDMAMLGRPEGTIPSANGQFKEPIVQTPNGPMPAQAYSAQGKQVDAAATAAGTNTQTPVDVMTRTGPGTISMADKLAGRNQVGADGKPNYLDVKSPQYQAIQSAQQADLKTQRDNATQATTGLDTATQLYNAANNLFTGKGSEAAQGIRRALVSLSQLTGQPIPESIISNTSKFEQLRYAALNFVQSAAHSFSPRAAVQVVRMIQAAKPGDTTSPAGLKAIIEKEVIPNFLRAQGMYSATDQYYQKNPLATDAAAQVPNQVPLTKFTVKHYPNSVEPGDYYVSRHDGSLKQRPVQ